ncbi:MAG: YraN family protein [Phoenicibacter congonensis]|uniref:UPF0102 protein Q3982_00045 n=1 Tax=Phoenicibacter congonensis TaxID=1944646 RepID=A0AA43RGH3_9ACTN|nr:YraN family protein [Phoenicibacter congonensis]
MEEVINKTVSKTKKTESKKKTKSVSGEQVKKTKSTTKEASSAVEEKPCDDTKKSNNKELGTRGEKAAERFLYRRNYEIIERNWRSRFGEADIIAMDDECLVFVEVKTRSTLEQGFPCEAVDAKKRAKYEKIALDYLGQSDLFDIPIRFDVIDIVQVDENRAAIRHHVNAFGVA